MILAFVGPSLSKVPRGISMRPPARQGDLWRALELKPSAIVLIDGVFESVPSVWHHELRAALASGIPVFGAASMGALRAAELAAFGMIGIGQIFRWYRDGVLNDDGAVALLHADREHGYRPLTVPLVNVMHVARGLKDGKRLVRMAREIFYQQRTWPEIWKRFGRRTPVEDLKALDARECLEAALALVRSKAPRRPVEPLDVSSFVRRRRLVDVHGARLRALEKDTKLTDDGTRALLLAGWARSLGVEPDPKAVKRLERQLRVADASERLRLARVLALEQWVLEHPEQMLPDGPSRLEGLAMGAMRAGRWR